MESGIYASQQWSWTDHSKFVLIFDAMPAALTIPSSCRPVYTPLPLNLKIWIKAPKIHKMHSAESSTCKSLPISYIDKLMTHIAADDYFMWSSCLWILWMTTTKPHTSQVCALTGKLVLSQIVCRKLPFTFREVHVFDLCNLYLSYFLIFPASRLRPCRATRYKMVKRGPLSFCWQAWEIL